jgi:hypothetical protein
VNLRFAPAHAAEPQGRSPSDETNRSSHHATQDQSVVLGLFLVFAAWSAFALFGLFRQNPFQVATETAAVIGGWSPEQVRFERGSYHFLFVCSVASARVAVTTDAGEVPTEVKLLHVPFAGWSVRTFVVGKPYPKHEESSAVAARL